MSSFDRATTIAAEFNATHDDVKLRVVPVPYHLATTDVTAFADTPRGPLLPGAVFAAIRGRRALHGEAVATGRLLQLMGYPSEKVGPSTFYRLDNTQRSRAD